MCTQLTLNTDPPLFSAQNSLSQTLRKTIALGTDSAKALVLGYTTTPYE